MSVKVAVCQVPDIRENIESALHGLNNLRKRQKKKCITYMFPGMFSSRLYYRRSLYQ